MEGTETSIMTSSTDSEENRNSDQSIEQDGNLTRIRRSGSNRLREIFNNLPLDNYFQRELNSQEQQNENENGAGNRNLVSVPFVNFRAATRNLVGNYNRSINYRALVDSSGSASGSRENDNSEGVEISR